MIVTIPEIRKLLKAPLFGNRYYGQFTFTNNGGGKQNIFGNIGYMMNTLETYSVYLKDRGWVQQKAPTKSKGNSMTVGEFVKKFKGHAIAHVDDNHVTYIADGKIWDLWDPSNHIMGEYWVPENELKKKK